MKTYKQLEIFLNLLLIVSFSISIIAFPKNDLLFIAYFIVGALQVTSMVIHELNNWFTAKKSTRRYYHWTVLILLLLFPTGFSFWFLLYTAPFFALFYMYICWKELQTLKFKAFVHLK
ncbi:MAG: hypothetical protein K2Q24_03135 [Chitinophagaceae bacterium]|jgi:hypothetical protein|nr:hypothetical protein [Chitinophagaceae bacterium]